MTTESPDDQAHTTISIRKCTKERLELIRPYDSLSWSEFAEELADVYEAHK